MPRGLYTALGQSLATSKGLQRQAKAMESEKSLIKWEGERERKQMEEMVASGVELFKIGKEIKKKGEEKEKVAAFAEEQGLTQQKDSWWKPAKWVTEKGTEMSTADILAKGHFMDMENTEKYGADWSNLSPSEKRKMSQVAGDPERFKTEFYGTYDEKSGETTYDSKYKTLSGEDMVKNYMAHGSFKGKQKPIPKGAGPELSDIDTGVSFQYEDDERIGEGGKPVPSDEDRQKMMKYLEYSGIDPSSERRIAGGGPFTPGGTTMDYDVYDPEQVSKYASLWDKVDKTGGVDTPEWKPDEPPPPVDPLAEERERYASGVNKFPLKENIFPAGSTVEDWWDIQDRKVARTEPPIRPDIPIDEEDEVLLPYKVEDFAENIPLDDSSTPQDESFAGLGPTNYQRDTRWDAGTGWGGMFENKPKSRDPFSWYKGPE